MRSARWLETLSTHIRSGLGRSRRGVGFAWAVWDQSQSTEYGWVVRWVPRSEDSGLARNRRRSHCVQRPCDDAACA